MTRIESIPFELRKLVRWVGVDAESKCPMNVYDGRRASATNVRSWGIFNDAKECVEKGIYKYIGFVFANDGYVGIDIDYGLDDLGFPTNEALSIISACKSYTEVSKSGKGFHIICKGDLPFDGKNNRAGVEIYKTKRYFVLTGQTTLYTEIVKAQDGIDYILDNFFNIDSEPTNENESFNRDKIWKPIYKIPSDATKIPFKPTFEVIGEGSRHIHLVSFCGQMWTAGVHKDFLLELALDANKNFFENPLSKDEVKQVVDSVSRYRR